MFDVETNRVLKKAPVVEVDIPKRIFSRPPPSEAPPQDARPSVLLDLWSFD